VVRSWRSIPTSVLAVAREFEVIAFLTDPLSIRRLLDPLGDFLRVLS
jgi:hypothetical protein